MQFSAFCNFFFASSCQFDGHHLLTNVSVVFDEFPLTISLFY